MANRPEAGGGRYVELAENRRAREAAAYGAPQEPTIPSAVEKLVAASQGVITKRIDLVMLEVDEMMARLVTRAAFVAFGLVLALAAWVAAVGALVLYVTPGAGTMVHLGIFAAINAAAGVAVVAAGVAKGVNKLPALGTEAEAQNASQRP